MVAVLTHGDKGKLYAYDGAYKCEDLWSRFYKAHCPTLAGKPKIFVIQACQGKLLDHGVTLHRYHTVNNNNNYNHTTEVDFSSYKVEKPLSENYYFPYQPVKEFDFLTVFSTAPGNYLL